MMMKTNWIFILIIMLVSNSCITQEKDLNSLNYTENYKDLFQEKKIMTEQYDIAAKLPLAYTYETKGFKFGSVNIPENAEDQISMNSVGTLLNNVKERKIVGIKISIDGIDNCKKMFDYLQSQYGTPKILMPVPNKNKEGWLVGHSAYSWDLKSLNRSLIVSQTFDLNFTESNKGKKYTQNEGVTIFIIDNNIKSDAQGYTDITTKELLLKTFSS